jgi:ABC-type glycerol-3-phosphate transport system substrate-binding protein
VIPHGPILFWHTYNTRPLALPHALRGTVTMAAWLYASPQSSAATEKEPARLYQKYMQMHPGVKLVMVPEPTGDFNAWFLTRAIADRLPDILQFPLSGWPYIQRGFLTPITKYLFQLETPTASTAGSAARSRWLL